MDWLEEEVTKLGEKKTNLESDISLLYLAKADLIKKSNLENIEKTAAEFISKFTSLTGIQQRSFIERMIAKIVIKKDNKLELHVLWDSKKSVTRTTESSIRKKNGGASTPLLEVLLKPSEMLLYLSFNPIIHFPQSLSSVIYTLKKAFLQPKLQGK